MPRRNENAKKEILTRDFSGAAFRDRGVATVKGDIPRPISFTVPGRPVPATRMTQKGKYVKKQAQRYLNYKEEVGWRARQATRTPFTGSVRVIIQCYIAQKGKMGDIDNYVKSILDGMNTIVYTDDEKVTELHAFRKEDNNERVEITVMAV